MDLELKTARQEINDYKKQRQQDVNQLIEQKVNQIVNQQTNRILTQSQQTKLVIEACQKAKDDKILS